MIKKSELSLRICDLEDTVECLSKKIARLERKTKSLEGEMTIIGECEPGFRDVCERSEEKYRKWKMRIKR